MLSRKPGSPLFARASTVLCPTLRSHSSTAHVPIFAISAYLDNKEWCEKAFAAGCDKCIGKPVDFGVLTEELRQFGTPH